MFVKKSKYIRLQNELQAEKRARAIDRANHEEEVSLLLARAAEGQPEKLAAALKEAADWVSGWQTRHRHETDGGTWEGYYAASDAANLFQKILEAIPLPSDEEKTS